MKPKNLSLFNLVSLGDLKTGLQMPDGVRRNHDVVHIDYKSNSDSYRSEDFSKENSDNLVLSVGCSFTYGVGLPFQYIWPVSLQERLGLDHHANIAAAGWGASTIIDSIYTYIRVYGKPKAVTMLLPNLQRYYTVFKINEKTFTKSIVFHHISPNRTDEDIIQDDRDLQFINKLMNEETLLYDLVHRLKQLEEYLLAIDVPLVYSCWDQDTSEKLESCVGLDNLVLIDPKEKEKYLFDNQYGYLNTEERNLWYSAADKAFGPSPHPGISENRFFAELFYRELKERYDI
jgi:hypothetical protein